LQTVAVTSYILWLKLKITAVVNCYCYFLNIVLIGLYRQTSLLRSFRIWQSAPM